ncbi:CBS domain-containing protein [Algoriphagus terrigena]|uniref:CBS domain-containing protein n=1 Tax=Algoriphagus terrigena TaxID=344884 RepID=UPI0003FF6240|nr:CBS domain-containing protein [Algoriphagus terrigena]
METNKRDNLAHALIGFSISGIILISIIYIYLSPNRDETGERLFSALLPLFSTWVGTVLVFYFGRESFESASKKYEQIINKLSPEVLADLPARQIMIDKYTMVSLPETDPRIAKADCKQLLQFLDTINKSRLPILKGTKVQYVVHKSILTEELAKNPTTPLTDFAAFLKKYPTIAQFGTISENDSVDTARKLMKTNGYKDVFVVGLNSDLVGWLTDFQIIRYMDVKS